MAREFGRSRQEPGVPSSTIGYFVREAFRRIWRSKRSSFVAISMIAMSLFILGALLLIAGNLERAVAQWQGSSRLHVYLDVDATPAQVEQVGRFLAAHGDLRTAQLVTRGEALQRFRSSFRELSDVVTQLGENPFPPSYDVDVAQEFVQSSRFHVTMNQVRALPGVEQIQYDWQWLERLRRIANVISLAGLIAGLVLGIAAAFTIANVIRLAMMLYREEIEIMRLVGATETMVRVPFVISGVIQGTLGGLLAVGLLFAAYTAAQRALAPSMSLLWGFLFNSFLPWQQTAALIAGGMLAGLFGSWLSVRERTA